MARAAFSTALHHHKPDEQGPGDANPESVKERTPRLTVPAASVQAADVLSLCFHNPSRRLQRERRASSEPRELSGSSTEHAASGHLGSGAVRGYLLPSAGDQEEQAERGPKSHFRLKGLEMMRMDF